MYKLVKSLARGCLSHVILNPMVMLSLSVIVIIGGALMLALVRQDNASARAIQQAATLGTDAVGGSAVVEARVSPTNPTVNGTLVAFVREAYSTCWESQCWVERARVTPPLVLDDIERPVRIVNDDYALGSTAHTVEEAQPTITEGTIRARGFKVGDTVLVIGIARSADEIEAQTMYAGTRADVLAYLSSGARVAVVGAWSAIVGGIAWGAFGVWVLMGHVREIRQEQRTEGSSTSKHAQRPGRKKRRKR